VSVTLEVTAKSFKTVKSSIQDRRRKLAQVVNTHPFHVLEVPQTARTNVVGDYPQAPAVVKFKSPVVTPKFSDGEVAS
jgi:hypothetical protein